MQTAIRSTEVLESDTKVLRAAVGLLRNALTEAINGTVSNSILLEILFETSGLDDGQPAMQRTIAR